MRLALLLIALALSHSALQDLLLTDTGGQGPTLESQMFLAATHGYAVEANGTVALGGLLCRIVGDGGLEAV